MVMNTATTTEKVEMEIRQRSASNFEPTSVNKEDGTVNAVFATDTPVRTWNYKIGDYKEILGFEDGMVRLERFNTTAPVLNNHNHYDESLGTVVSAKIVGNSLVGKMRFDLADEAGAKAFGKIERGFTKSVSIGYRVYKIREIGEEEGLPVYMATDWEPYEISTVCIPADTKAAIRNDNQEKILVEIIKTTKTPNMENNNAAAEPALNDDAKRNLIADTSKVAIAAERTRVAEITALAEKAKLGNDFIANHIKEGTALEAVRTLVLDEVIKKQPTPTVGSRGDGGWKGVGARTGAIADAIAFRMSPETFKLDVEKGGNEFVNMRLMDVVQDALIQNGLSTDGSQLNQFQRAMDFGMNQRSNGSMSASDLPSVFLNVMNKFLRRDYQFETGKWKPITYNQDASNLRNNPSINLGEFGALDKVLEGAEYKQMAVADNYENFQVYKFGNNAAITLEMIINDDLGAMQRMLFAIARSQNFTEDKLVWNLFTDAAITMRDGVAVYHASHANLGTAGAMSATTLNELYLKVRTQTGLGGKVLDLTPKYIICGPTNEFLVSQLTSSNYTPTKTSDVMPGYLKSLIPIVTAYITDGSYFVAADPNTIDTIRTGGLTGYPSFQIDEKIEWKNDSYVFHARKFFGAAYTDYRGLAKNAGA